MHTAAPAYAAGHPHPDSNLQLGRRTFQMIGMMAAGPGLGQCWPGLRTWRESMAKYQDFSQQVDASALAADKKKHMKACAKISSVIKGITGSSFLAYTTTMTIGVAKEWFDGIVHALTGKGHKEYLDLEADHVGARLVYQDTAPETLDGVTGTFEECQALWRRYEELIQSGRYEEAEVIYRRWQEARRRFDRFETAKPKEPSPEIKTSTGGTIGVDTSDDM